MRLVTCLGLILLVLGCTPTTYLKPGATALDFDIDKDHCSNRVSMAAGYGAYDASQQIANAIVYGRSMMDECLRGKGWRPATAEELQRAQAQKTNPGGSP